MTEPTKACNICGVCKSLDSYPPHLDRCRDCHNALRRERRANPSPPVPRGLYPLALKACTTCERIMRPWLFHWRKRTPSGLAPECKSCASVRMAASHKAHLSARHDAAAKRRSDPAYKEAARMASSSWRAENPARATLLNKSSKATRRAAEAAVLSIPFTSEQLLARIDYYGKKCWMCSAPYEHIDHVKPISRGGANILANLRPACAACNFTKRAKWFGPQQLHRFIKN